ncbi:MAG: hypothetical protein HYU60_01615 [Magnetospirillum sp.]|nr:hypothetical protein [Magnetospirillum sp.]
MLWLFSLFEARRQTSQPDHNPLRSLPRDDLILCGMFKSTTEIDMPVGRRINDMAHRLEALARQGAEVDACGRPLKEPAKER